MTDEERIQRVRQAKWIGYTRAKELLDKMEDLLNHPRVQRMPNLLIVGETNDGKSVLVKRFQHLHPASDNAAGDGVIVPMLLIQAPPYPKSYGCTTAFSKRSRVLSPARLGGAEAYPRVDDPAQCRPADVDH